VKNIVQVHQLLLVTSSKKTWNPETSDCMGQYFLKKGMRETSYFSYYMKLFDEPEAIADLQQDKQKPAIFFTHLLCLL